MSIASGTARAAPQFHRDVLRLDPEAETDRIVRHLRTAVSTTFRRRGGVVGVSGGIDSSVALALAVRALGPERVVPLLLQERESAPENAVYVRELCRDLGVTPVAQDITGALEGLGCYRLRDEAIRCIFPSYDATYRSKISLPDDLLNRDSLNVFSLTIISPEGVQQRARLPLSAYLQIVAATNFKQRTRMAVLYYHAELRNYAVIGTANRNERSQGFFVKFGDGGADVDAIVHLYKTQVYQLASYLGIPDRIMRRTPTTDTYSAASTEEEFFFRLPFETMDLLLYAEEQGTAPSDAARIMGLNEEQVERAYRDFQQKRRAAAYLRSPILALQPQDLATGHYSG